MAVVTCYQAGKIFVIWETTNLQAIRVSCIRVLFSLGGAYPGTSLIISISRPAIFNCSTDQEASIKLDWVFPSNTPSQQERTFSSKAVSLNGFSGPPR